MEQTRAFYIYATLLLLTVAYILGNIRTGAPSILSLLLP